MEEPRKKAKKKRKTGRPLEDVPLRTLLRNVRTELDERIKISFSGKDDKAKQD